MLTIACPTCSKTRKAPDDAIGRTAKCSCGHTFVLGETPLPLPWPEPLAAPLSRTVLAAAIVGVLLVAAGASTAILLAMRARTAPAAPTPPVPDSHVTKLETRVAELEKKLSDQLQLIGELKAEVTKARPPRIDNSGVNRQLTTHADSMRMLANSIDEVNERFRVGFILQFRTLSEADRNDFKLSIDALNNKTLTWDQFLRGSRHLGGVGFACLFLRQIQEIRDCLARDFESQGANDLAKLLRADKID